MNATKISPPNTYSEWIDVFDMLKNKTDDEAVLDAMYNGKIDWQIGVAERFCKHLIEAISHRMNVATDKFQKELGHSAGQERVLVQSLHAMRKEFCFLSKAISLPTIPEDDRKHLHQLVIDQVNKVQMSLENSAKFDRTGKLAVLLKNNKVNVF